MRKSFLIVFPSSIAPGSIRVIIQQFDSPVQLSESFCCWIEIYRSRGAIWEHWGRSNDACNAVYDGNNSSNTEIMTVLGVIVVHRV